MALDDLKQVYQAVLLDYAASQKYRQPLASPTKAVSLVNESCGHTLVIHSEDQDVIRQFMLKKPVGRILINTPAAFGAMGATTNLFPSMILGGLSAGLGITSDNVSPMNLVYMRNAAWGVREVSELEGFDESGTGRTEAALDVTGLLKTILRQLED